MFPVQILAALRAEFGAQIIFFRHPDFHAAVFAFKRTKRRFIWVRDNHSPAKCPSAMAVRIPAAIRRAVFLTGMPRIKSRPAYRTYFLHGSPYGNIFSFSAILQSPFIQAAKNSILLFSASDSCLSIQIFVLPVIKIDGSRIGRESAFTVTLGHNLSASGRCALFHFHLPPP